MHCLVVIRTRSGWAPILGPVEYSGDLRRLERVARLFARGVEVRVLGARNDSELERLYGDLVSQTRDAAERAITRGKPGTAAEWHILMNRMELGPGSDRDAVYTYQSVPNEDLAAAWLQLAARVHRGEVGGPLDGLRSSAPS